MPAGVQKEKFKTSQKYLYRNEVFLNDTNAKPLSKYVQETFLNSTERNGIKPQLNGDIFVKSSDNTEFIANTFWAAHICWC